MTPPAYTLTPEQTQRLHGACDAKAIACDVEPAGFAYFVCRMRISAQFEGQQYTATSSIARRVRIVDPELDILAELAESAINVLETEFFDHMRPQLRKHLASLPAHALRKSIHQIEDEWLPVLDKQWLDFVAREIQLAQLEDAALITE